MRLRAWNDWRTGSSASFQTVLENSKVGKLRRAGLLEYFAVTVFSEDTGLGKPHPSIFQEACRQAGQEPENCIHVGDDLTNDMHASHALGIHPVWIDRLGAVKDAVPGRRITSLVQLANVLEEEFCSA